MKGYFPMPQPCSSLLFLFFLFLTFPNLSPIGSTITKMTVTI